jgi:tRNA 2-thiouridine synthesizing protein A
MGTGRTADRIMKFDVELDARQLACPLPILRAKKSLSQMPSGQIIRIAATDKGSLRDFYVFYLRRR